MRSSAAEIDLKLRDDFRRYLREYGIDSAVVDPVLAVMFRTFAAQLYAASSDTDRLRTALLDELIEGLSFERRSARPAQTIVRYTCSTEVTIGSGTDLVGEPESGGRITFSTDYGMSASDARIAAVFVYQNGSLRLISGMELPEDTLRAGPSYAPVPASLGPDPAIYICVEKLLASHLSRHGFFFQVSPEASLLAAQLPKENWSLASADGAFGAEGILRPRELNAGQISLHWLEAVAEKTSRTEEIERPALPGGFWNGRCFVFPQVPADRRFLCEAPRGFETPLRALFERRALFLRPRAWIRIPLSSRVEPLHTAVSAVHVNAQSASNVECFNQTVRFNKDGVTVPISREVGGASYLVAPLAITGESGNTYVPEFQPSFLPGNGRFRLHQGYLTLMPGKLANGDPETYVNVRLWMTSGAAGNQLGAARLNTFGKAAPVSGIQVTNLTSAAGGTDGESFSVAKQRFAEALTSRQRLLTRTDLEVAVRGFDRRVSGIQIQPVLVRTATGLRRLHRITLAARRDNFTAPEEEARVLLSDLTAYLEERVPLDIKLDLRLEWS